MTYIMQCAICISTSRSTPFNGVLTIRSCSATNNQNIPTKTMKTGRSADNDQKPMKNSLQTQKKTTRQSAEKKREEMTVTRCCKDGKKSVIWVRSFELMRAYYCSSALSTVHASLSHVAVCFTRLFFLPFPTASFPPHFHFKRVHFFHL